MGWLNFGGKKRDRDQGFGKSQQRKSRKPRRTFVLEKIVTPSVGVGDWLPDLDSLQQLASSLSLPDLQLPNLLADGDVCPIDPAAPTNNLPPLIDFDPLGLYDSGIATQPTDNIGGAFETLPIAVIPVDPQSPHVNDPNAIRQLLDFPAASQPLVGTIDTGVNGNNPYLNYANIKKGRDYVGGDNNPLLQAGEGSEHGTFMLGIIDAINKKAPKWVGRAIDSGRWADSLVEFVDAAKASGQKNAIANLSLDLTQKNADGSVTTRYELTPAERSAIEYARQNGVLLVVAAGNDGGVMSVLGQASQEFDNIITVGSADGNNRADYSSFGRGLDILAEGGTSDNPELSTVGDGVGTMAGTSVATAKVAGATSLVWAANPDLSYRQVIEILEKTAKDLGAPGRDDETGFGFLNTLAAVDLAKKTTPEVYNPEDFLTLTSWSKQGQITPAERAVQVHQVQNPWGRRFYYGWLNNSNRMDRFDFKVTSPKLLQFSLKDGLGSDFLEAQVSLYDDYGNRYPVNQPDPSGSYRTVNLYPGNYQLQVDKGSRYEIDPYKLTLNFNENNNTSVIDESIWLPRPVISQPPVFTPPPSQPSVPIVIQPPPVDWQRIAEEQARAELLRQQQAEAAAKAAAEASAKAAAEAAAKAAAEAAQRRRLEAEENARKAIDLASDRNKSWLGNSLAGVQIDWNTLLNSRVAAIQYFEGGYVVWNGIHAVAYQTGPGNSSATNVTPVEVRLHDLGMQYGRKEYGQYVGFSKRDDYYKFTVENLGNFYPHDLLFALRSNGVDLPLTDATIEILDSRMKRVPLSQAWQPNGQPGLSTLTDTTYYVRVKPAKDNLNYGFTLNLDSAHESLVDARPLGAITGRRQFRDFVGNKGDGLGDYYSFSVEHPSLLHFSLSELDAGADANVELLDSNGNAVTLDSLSGKVGAKKLLPGVYYLRVNAANNTNTNYTLTMQMAEDLGTYTGRHEYKDRYVGGKNQEAYYRLNIDAPAEELHLALKNLSADANVELLRDNGSGIVNSTLIDPVAGSNRSGTESEYKGYANVQPGNYLVRVYFPNLSTQAAKYDLVMNLDRAGEDWSKTRDLGMLTDIAQLSDYQFSDFVGADKGDSSDVYKFQVGDYGLVHFALKKPNSDAEANMLAGNMRLQDESGKDVTFLNPQKDATQNYAAAYLEPGKSYYLSVIPTPGMMTNYNLVINPVSEETINGFRVSDNLYKVFAKYRESIGKPTSAVTNQSSGVKYQAFQNALIISSSYGTYPVWWGIKDAYLNKYGSLSGKLGAPKGMEYDWNGGKRQDFAGGYITWRNGATNAYKPNGSLLYPPPAPASSGGSGKAISLNTYYQLLYGHTNAASFRQFNTPNDGGHDAIDSNVLANEPSKQVHALVGGTVRIAKNGVKLDNVFTEDKVGWGDLPASGERVKAADYNGTFVIWNEELQREFWYLHLAEGSINEELRGKTIQAGEIIGIEGETGYSFGVHTHVHVDNKQGSGGTKEDPQVVLGIAREKGLLANQQSLNSSTIAQTSQIVNVSIEGQVTPLQGVSLRNSPQENDKSNKIEPYQTLLSFDAWTLGDTVNDYQSNIPDNGWYKIAGESYWVPSAYVQVNRNQFEQQAFSLYPILNVSDLISSPLWSGNERKIYSLREEIKKAAADYNVPPELLGAIIFDELERWDWDYSDSKNSGRRSEKRSWKYDDTPQDLLAAQWPYAVPDNWSLGIAQIEVRKVQELENVDTLSAVIQLLNEAKSVRLAAHYLSDIMNKWDDKYPQIKNGSEESWAILGTLYSKGVGTPHKNPKSNERGKEIAEDARGRIKNILEYGKQTNWV
jgi:Subtilase family